MEPNEIDKIIKSRLEQGHGLYDSEMAQAKPFIWSAVRNSMEDKRQLTWRHLVAAMILLIVSFSIAFYASQKSYQKELDNISARLNSLQKGYNSQVKLIEEKETQVDLLDQELRNTRKHLEGLSQTSQVPNVQVLHHRDTVYLTRVEYVAAVPDSEEPGDVQPNAYVEDTAPVQAPGTQGEKINNAIFPDYSGTENKKKAENIRLQFGSFAARNN